MAISINALLNKPLPTLEVACTLNGPLAMNLGFGPPDEGVDHGWPADLIEDTEVNHLLDTVTAVIESEVAKETGAASRPAGYAPSRTAGADDQGRQCTQSGMETADAQAGAASEDCCRPVAESQVLEPADTEPARAETGQGVVATATVGRGGLHVADAPWRLLRPETAADLHPDLRTVRRVTAVLNKVPLNGRYAATKRRLREMLGKVQVETELGLYTLVAAVHDRAVSDARSARICALTCIILANLQVAVELRPGRKITFCEMLPDVVLRYVKEDREMQRSRRLMELQEEENITIRRQKIHDLRVEKGEAHRRAMNHICLVGCLFRLRAISVGHMYWSISALLRHKHVGSLRVVCALLSQVGERLEKTKTGKEWIADLFKELDALTKSDALQSSTKFWLMNLVQLRAQNWVQCRHDRTARTTDKSETGDWKGCSDANMIGKSA
ncbi:uncharacterized protein LOC119093568 [Pollicipes pollicipes]|uniref:uncharacterized protein LOC119093568 n=1 Tax=Pollicipes pollicipes TaxID=41117 RepID=UPI001884A20E|nr:uncharacterized protein LOC119093568 [Pollicipes pollicipes]